MYLYMHITPSGKKYVGITVQKPEERWRKGKGYIYNEHFYNAVLKYGWDNIQHIILYDNLTEDEANKLEEELIEKYNLTNPKFGYNQHTGGLHHKTTELTREKISKAHKGLHIGEKNPFFGKKHAEEILDRFRKPIEQYSKAGEYITTYNSIVEAYEATNADKSEIVKCCKEKRLLAGGYQWKYKGSDKVIKPYKRTTVNKRKVLQLDKTGKIIKLYDSLFAAGSQFSKYADKSIGACCRGEQPTAYGYVWRYE